MSFSFLCGHCSKPFARAGRVAKYCSHKCRALAAILKHSKPCEVCGQLFHMRGRRPNQRFCSARCYAKFQTTSEEKAEAGRQRRDFFATREELLELYVTQKKTMREIATRFNVTQKKVFGILHYYKIELRKAVQRNPAKGSSHPSWQGGRVMQGRYIYLSDPSHPNAMKNSYVAEHIVIATKRLGHALVKGECVHHIDGNKKNNHPDNLHVCLKKEHSCIHAQLDSLALAMYRAGLIEFRNGEYILTEKVLSMMK